MIWSVGYSAPMRNFNKPCVQGLSLLLPSGRYAPYAQRASVGPTGVLAELREEGWSLQMIADELRITRRFRA